MMRIARYALSAAIAALLTGCSGSQPPTAAPSSIAQTHAANLFDTSATSAPIVGSAHRTSSAYSDLIYTISAYSEIYMFDYPSGSFVGSFFPPANVANGMCTDTSGNVYVLAYGDGYTQILKYAHGATNPGSIISYPYEGFSCSVDPTTGDLAVLGNGSGFQVTVAIFSASSDTPVYYNVPAYQIARGDGCTYDSSGNLFVDYQGKNYNADDIAELPAGGNTFSVLTPNKHIKVKTLLWVSSYLAAVGKGVIYHLAVSGSHARVISETKAEQAQHFGWIQDSDILISPYGHVGEQLGYWNYPEGGKVTKILPRVDKYFKNLRAVLISAVADQKTTKRN